MTNKNLLETLHKIRKVVDRFNSFKIYKVQDYDTALRKISELLEDVCI